MVPVQKPPRGSQGPKRWGENGTRTRPVTMFLMPPLPEVSSNNHPPLLEKRTRRHRVNRHHHTILDRLADEGHLEHARSPGSGRKVTVSPDPSVVPRHGIAPATHTPIRVDQGAIELEGSVSADP